MRHVDAADAPGFPNRFLAGLAALVLFLAAAFHLGTAVSIVGATVRAAGGPPQLIHFPYKTEVPAEAVLEFSFTIPRSRLTQGSVRFIPDDHFLSLSVNGREVPLDSVAPARLDDYGNGFRFRIGPYLHAGDNGVVVRVRNSGGPCGLDVRSDSRDWPNVAEILAALVAFGCLLVVVLRRLGWQWPVVCIFVAGAAIRFAYLTVTPFSTRTHDVEGHIEYVEYILAHHSLPPPNGGWCFYHPPLYYLLAAGLWKAIVLVGITSRDTILCALQVQSILYQLGFLVLSILTFDLVTDGLPDAAFGSRFSSRSGVRALFAALSCFWPSGVIHSVRVGNDDLLYLFFGGGLYAINRWWLEHRDRDLHWAAVCGALAIVTKTNGLLVFGLVGALLVARFFEDSSRRVLTHLKRAWPSALLWLSSTAMALGRAAIDTASGKRAHLLVGNAGGLGDNLVVGNRAMNYLWFDAKTFVTHAFADADVADGGRQFFWNYALKSSLFGQFEFEQVRLVDLATVLSVLFLGILAYFVLGIALRPPGGWRCELPSLLAVGILISSLAALRMSKPVVCAGDFRYILPVLTPFLCLVVRGLVRAREVGRARLAGWGLAIGWSFAAASALFFLVLAAVA